MSGYRRVLLKISGEALMGSLPFGFCPNALTDVCARLCSVNSCEVAVVIGAGNLFRGGRCSHISRFSADQIGMLATVMNAVSLRDGMRSFGKRARVFSTCFYASNICEGYSIDRAAAALSDGEIAVCAGGTGAPFFTTDTAAVLRACELSCDAVFKWTNVDGVYSADPKKYADAEFYPKLSYQEALDKKLGVMDLTAITMAWENNMPIVVFSPSKNLSDDIALKNKCSVIGA
ncbi:uridine monophosphate kinase [Candidatus Hydrogenosomobacter endosymbioticus]|uniref:Uridylate kinase n=1 Tax=Candidatus Hydrogenosomobacter endosymbioticus TaxID=2558174 RepID=A0ABM7V8F5_9PROT|nr:uridine monophosphate kinase [Candidatus Hydrogenosomobacter endosymbioticus]BDB96051.1 uridylate kinase [Candidatus Hydrogenosomobacter endosymbioticus]